MNLMAPKASWNERIRYVAEPERERMHPGTAHLASGTSKEDADVQTTRPEAARAGGGSDVQ
jgi:hypothetical protein